MERWVDELSQAIFVRPLEIGDTELGKSLDKLMERFRWMQHKGFVANPNAREVLRSLESEAIVNFPKADARRNGEPIAHLQ